ncbi:Cationic amino acid transporter 7 [Hibiscus syriacus]|uniref:Cationic amino acid transporter 7 n=1 Tax=Hibiscus syriacus TaxID=106335 RepID=A0A6A3ADJ0_HIBSY|nr:Cationic amino acid transporter 7 [Hibiscus syriacus]
METHYSSFSTLRSYLHALPHTFHRFTHRAPSVSSSYEELGRLKGRSGSDMQKTLCWFDLLCLGIGGMVGADVFVTTGRASRLYAGPAIVISYAIAGLCALLSAFCYTEIAVHLPVVGCAFSYLQITFSEFVEFLTGANLITEYVMSNTAVARGFTSYLGAAMGISTTKWRFILPFLPNGFDEIDLIAPTVVMTITLVICYSTRESSVNPSGFFPYGASGVFNGAAMVYLSYIGYDAVSTMDDEVRDPVKDIPIGVSGSVVIVTVLYCLMAASMSMLLTYDMMEVEAPFTAAFRGRREWVGRVIGAGASLGIVTSLLVAMLGQARYMCVIGRSRVVSAWFARVHPKTSTPVNASVFLGTVLFLVGIFTAAISLFTELNVPLNMASISTLFVFYVVSNAVVYRRYVVIGTTKPWPTLSFLCLFSLTSIIFTLVWHFAPPEKPKPFVLAACVVIAVSILQVFCCTVPQARKPSFWGVPFMPWLPFMSIFLNVFLLGSLDGPSYARFGFFSAMAVLVYVLYSVHASFDAEMEGSLGQKSVEILEESTEVKRVVKKCKTNFVFAIFFISYG